MKVNKLNSNRLLVIVVVYVLVWGVIVSVWGYNRAFGSSMDDMWQIDPGLILLFRFIAFCLGIVIGIGTILCFGWAWLGYISESR